MRYFTRARKPVNLQFTFFCAACSRRGFARLLLAVFAGVVSASVPARCQDSGNSATEFHGSGAEISVTVRDGSGGPVSSPVIVRLYRGGSLLGGPGVTSQGRMSFIVTSIGEFTVVAQAADYPSVEKEVYVSVEGKTQVDIYLRTPGKSVAVPGKPILAPKAQEAFDRGLQALGADKLREAEKFVGEAVRLAPGHPDVLYVQGVLNLKQRNWEQAQGALEKATQVDPNHARAFAALGMALSDQGKYEAAIAPLEKSVQLDAAADFETRWVLAQAYYERARYEEALTSSQAALTTSKGRAPEIELLVAQALTAVGRYEDAARALRGFLRRYGGRPEAGKARRWLTGLQASGKVAPE